MYLGLGVRTRSVSIYSLKRLVKRFQERVSFNWRGDRIVVQASFAY